jgi:Domain of unknown function (DUF4190)
VVALVLVVLILFSPLGALLGLVAVILGILGIVRVNRVQADNRGQAVAGLVTGALALVAGLFFAVGIGDGAGAAGGVGSPDGQPLVLGAVSRRQS